MNAAYVMGTRLTDAFAKYGFCTAIRGAEGGGKVEGLPAFIFTSDDGDTDLKCPTEIGITDRREAELSKLGFLPLCHYKNTDYAVFFGARPPRSRRSTTGPKPRPTPPSRRGCPTSWPPRGLPTYLKVMARDKIGSFMEASDCEEWLNRWIKNYVNANRQGAARSPRPSIPCARPRSRSRRSPASRVPTTPSPACAPGSSWRS